jgi:hypothetical protein
MPHIGDQKSTPGSAVKTNRRGRGGEITGWMRVESLDADSKWVKVNFGEPSEGKSVGSSQQKPSRSFSAQTDPDKTSGTKRAAAGEYRFALLVLILGVVAMLGGAVTGLHWIADNTSWTARLLGLKSKIDDTAPGVVLFVVGLFMVFETRSIAGLKNLKG